MSATVEFHGQLSACLAEIPQRKSEGDHLIELRRMGSTADPSDFTIARKEFGSLRGHRGILHDQSYQMTPYVAVGVHPRHDFLPRIAALIQTKRFPFQIRLSWEDLFVQVRSGLWQPCFNAESLTSETTDCLNAIGRTGLHEPFPGRMEGIGGQ